MYFCESYWSLTIQFLGYPILNNLDTYHPIPISIIHTDLSNETPHLRATSVAHFKGELRLGQVLVPLKWTYFSSESSIYPLVIKHANDAIENPLCVDGFFPLRPSSIGVYKLPRFQNMSVVGHASPESQVSSAPTHSETWTSIHSQVMNMTHI